MTREATPARQPRTRRRWPRLPWRLWALLILVVAGAEAKTHTVYEGQRLGSIAKRYNVSVEDLCAANGISPRDPIRPGQKLVIPGTEPDPQPAQEKGAATAKGKDAKAKEKSKASGEEKAEAKPKPGKPRSHVVAKGHTLSAIAGRYGVTVEALCTANDLTRASRLEVGSTLVVPHKTDRDGSYARKLRRSGRLDVAATDEASTKKSSARRGASWAPYVKPAWRKGYLKIRRYGRSWQGYVIGPKGEVLGHASKKINFVLGAGDGGPEIDERLIRLIASVSDKFGGREVRIVSGYRTKSFVAASKHKEGKALDFSIPGVPNEALRDYLRSIDDVGVGYYPNSSFVHLDVRSYNAYWVDYAGPGEAPRRSPRKKGKPSGALAAGEPVPDETTRDPAAETEHEHTDEHTDEPTDDEPPDDAAPDDRADLVTEAVEPTQAVEE